MDDFKIIQTNFTIDAIAESLCFSSTHGYFVSKSYRRLYYTTVDGRNYYSSWSPNFTYDAETTQTSQGTLRAITGNEDHKQSKMFEIPNEEPEPDFWEFMRELRKKTDGCCNCYYDQDSGGEDEYEDDGEEGEKEEIYADEDKEEQKINKESYEDWEQKTYDNEHKNGDREEKENVDEKKEDKGKTENVDEKKDDEGTTENVGKKEEYKGKTENVGEEKEDEGKTKNANEKNDEEGKTENVSEKKDDEGKTENVDEKKEDERKTESVDEKKEEEGKTQNPDEKKEAEGKTDREENKYQANVNGDRKEVDKGDIQGEHYQRKENYEKTEYKKERDESTFNTRLTSEDELAKQTVAGQMMESDEMENFVIRFFGYH